MANESVVMKIEDDLTLQSCTRAVEERKADPDLEMKDVKLASELILSDCEDEASSQAIGSKVSLPFPTEESNSTVALRRTVKIILTRSDVGDKRNFNQSNISRISPENCSGICAAWIKVEPETCITTADDPEAGASNSKLLNHDPQTTLCVGIKKEEGSVMPELVRHLPSCLKSEGVVKSEERELRPDSCHCSAVVCTNEEIPNELCKIPQPKSNVSSETQVIAIANTVIKEPHNLGEDLTLATVVKGVLDNCLPPDAHVKEDDESNAQITSELVRNLPLSGHSSRCLKSQGVVKAEECELQPDSYHSRTVGCTNEGTPNKLSKVPQPKSEVSSKTQVLVDTVKKETYSSGEDLTIETVVKERLSNSDARVKEDEGEQIQITNELVRNLPLSGRPPRSLKRSVVKSEESELRPDCYHYPIVGCTNEGTPNKSAKVSQPNSKVLSKKQVIANTIKKEAHSSDEDLTIETEVKERSSNSLPPDARVKEVEGEKGQITSELVRTLPGEFKGKGSGKSGKEELRNFEAAEAKLESELILSDCDDEVYSEEFVERKSLPSSTEPSRTIVPQDRIVKIILERCDAARVPKFSSKQSRVSKPINENFSNAGTRRIKLENEFESLVLAEGGTCCRALDESVPTVAGNDNTPESLQPNSFEENAKSSAKLIPANLEETAVDLGLGHADDRDCSGLIRTPSTTEDKLSLYKINAKKSLFKSRGSTTTTFLALKTNITKGTSYQNALNDSQTQESIPLQGHTTAEVKSDSKASRDNTTNKTLSSTKNLSTKFKKRTKKQLVAESRPKHFSCKQCPAQFKFKSLLLKPVTSHSDKKLYACDQCLAQFKCQRNLKRHSLTYCKRYFSCEQCSAQFRIKNSLKYHLLTHNKERRFSCAQCSARFKTKNDLKRHLSTHSKARPFFCALCSAGFKTKGELNQHLPTHSEVRPFSCAVCSAEFKAKRHLKLHLSVHSEVRPFSCTQCSAQFKTKGDLKQHLSTHSEVRPFFCAQCAARFKTKRELNQHLPTHSEIRPFCCALCSARFKTKRELKQHLSTHSKVTPFSCTQCFARGKTKRQLKKHLPTHSEVRPFSCVLCSARFKTKHHLKLHLSVHSEVRPFSCTQCSTQFKTKGDLKQHSSTHSEVRPFFCAQCAARFKTKRELNQHLPTHSEIRPFCCALCSARFKTKRELKQHLSTHSKVTPFSCTQCFARCKTKRQLKKHLPTHSEVRPFSCALCPVLCSTKPNENSISIYQLTVRSDLFPVPCALPDLKPNII